VHRNELDRLVSGGSLVALLGLAVAFLIAPGAVWDGFIWPYLWGPLVADSEGGSTSTGIREGYNPISTLLYAVILAIAVYAIYRLLQRLRVRPGLPFLIAILPWLRR